MVEIVFTLKTGGVVELWSRSSLARDLVILMAVRSSPSVERILSALAAYGWRVSKNTNVTVHLLIADKTVLGIVETANLSLTPFQSVGIHSRPREESLTESILHLAKHVPRGANNWVQIVADDDSVFSSDLFRFSPRQKTTMMLADIALVGRGVKILTRPIENLSRKNAGPDLAREIEGDKSWHGIVRNDVFQIYVEWLTSLSKHPHTVTNGLVWVALAVGDIEPLNHFLYIKEASFYDSHERVAQRENRSHLAIFGFRLGRLQDSLTFMTNSSLLLFALTTVQNKNMAKILNIQLREWLSSMGAVEPGLPNLINGRIREVSEDNSVLLQSCIRHTNENFGLTGSLVMNALNLIDKN